MVSYLKLFVMLVKDFLESSIDVTNKELPDESTEGKSTPDEIYSINDDIGLSFSGGCEQFGEE